jgi:hypothetical protein
MEAASLMPKVPQKKAVYAENLDNRLHDLKQVGDILKLVV